MTAILQDVVKSRLIAGMIFCLALLFADSNLLAQGNGLQSGESQAIDTQPPVIELEELANSAADSTQVFTAQIAEDNELQDATLYYRREGQQAYQATPMLPLASTGFYSVSISTEPTDLRNIEYYIQARDSSGNRTVSGFAFDPYVRVLTPFTAGQGGTGQSAESNSGSIDAQTRPLYAQRWFQIAVGVVAVGLLASTQGGGNDETRLVPLTINVE